ncbi:thaumatin family-domain-containing protein [Dioszegia hungarica]|uniref:Thaumatin family-domain-containing protein n=1 Tax=Dioszegia hungarica TaxID=4972 RepID=A0AA38LWK7_9TREE|nr:thaumatin family-domain-containing protein [Dioszegia hungarica]KAI9636779.1 thaumatin family-domain-containing protein [Dioszegia hungarica]
MATRPSQASHAGATYQSSARSPHTAKYRSSSMPAYLLMLVVALIPATQAVRKITIDNQCKGTVWPAIQVEWPKNAPPGPNPTKMDGSPQPFGWKQPPGKYSFQVPDDWTRSRIWARTGCKDDGTGCKIGGCASGGQCNGRDWGGSGGTLAEFTLLTTKTIHQSTDNYDVSMVDGFNLPMTISHSAGCETASCGVGAGHDILTMCDSRLAYPPGSDVVWGCVSPCNVGKQLSPAFSGENSVWCCNQNGVAISPQTRCDKKDIPFYTKYKPHCQKAYVFPADDNYHDPDAVFMCNKPGDFTITLCPGGIGEGTAPKSKPIVVDPGISLLNGGRLGMAKRRADVERSE